MPRKKRIEKWSVLTTSERRAFRKCKITKKRVNEMSDSRVIRFLIFDNMKNGKPYSASVEMESRILKR